VSFDYKAKRFVRGAHLPPVERHHAWKEIFSLDAQDELLSAPRTTDPLDVYRARYAETEGSQELARLQDLDLGIYLVDDLLVKTDRASMAHSLEARVPFLDPVVAELALALETRQKVRGFSKKRLLRRAAAPLLPKEIIRGRKRGFSIPVAAWLRGDLAGFARDVLSPETVERQGYLDPSAVTRVLDDHIAGREDLSRQIWGLLNFTLWFDRYAREPTEAAATAQRAG
jgi:asparagine synthase (glutamine-hydrolysing)